MAEPIEKEGRTDTKALNVRFEADIWPLIEDLRLWYRVDSMSQMIRLLISDAHDLASGKGLPSVSPLASTAIRERQEGNERGDGAL